MVFDSIAQAFADLLGTTPEIAGFILGFSTIMVLLIAFLIVLDKQEITVGYLGAGVGVAFVAMVGWWPLWSIIFIALLVALLLVQPFASSTD